MDVTGFLGWTASVPRMPSKLPREGKFQKKPDQTLTTDPVLSTRPGRGPAFLDPGRWPGAGPFWGRRPKAWLFAPGDGAGRAAAETEPSRRALLPRDRLYFGAAGWVLPPLTLPWDSHVTPPPCPPLSRYVL